ncbi:hypothetical protein [Streptomyces sp. NPDC058330]|uniref:hypothetical protein n=1 Tax=Streptomyces sp. NPDC058330 TaxID=3346449 RepID=UPI0036DFE32B
MADANECHAPRIGLPRLEVVIWPEPSDDDERDRGLTDTDYAALEVWLCPWA